jgi:hypothetical protein
VSSHLRGTSLESAQVPRNCPSESTGKNDIVAGITMETRQVILANKTPIGTKHLSKSCCMGYNTTMTMRRALQLTLQRRQKIVNNAVSIFDIRQFNNRIVERINYESEDVHDNSAIVNVLVHLIYFYKSSAYSHCSIH